MSTIQEQIIKARTQQAMKAGAPRAGAGSPPRKAPSGLIWNDGKKHSISLAAHNQHVADAEQAKLDSTLYNPAKILSGEDLRNTVNSLADLQVNPTLSALDRQSGDVQRQSDATTANARAYYAQLAEREQALANQAKASETDSNQQAAGLSTAAQQAQAALAQANQDRMGEDAAVRGNIATTTADQLAKAYADRASSVASRSGADQTARAVKGAANSQAAIGEAQSAGLRGGEAITGLTNQFAKTLGDIAGKKTDTLASRGGLVADLTQKLRQQGYDNIITQKGLGLKQSEIDATTAANTAKIAETTRHNQAMESTAERTSRLGDKRYQLDKDKFGASKAKDMYQRRHKVGPYRPAKTDTSGGSSVTPAQRDARTQKSLDFWSKLQDGDTILDQAKAALPGVNADRAKNKQPLLGWNDATARNVLRSKGYQPWEIDALIAARHNGGLMPADQVAALKGRHITVKNTKRLASGGSPAAPSLDIAGTLGGLPG